MLVHPTQWVMRMYEWFIISLLLQSCVETLLQQNRIVQADEDELDVYCFVSW